MAKNNSNKKNQSVKNQSANSLQYLTYTSAKSGKTIPVVVGFTGKDDERIAYIAQIGKDGEPSAVHGRYTCLPVGKGEERIPCVMWGADPAWHEVAKLAVKTVNNLDALTQEDYDALCEKAEKVYQERKVASEQERKEREAQKAEKPQSKAQPKVPSNSPKREKKTPKEKVEVYKYVHFKTPFGEISTPTTGRMEDEVFNAMKALKESLTAELAKGVSAKRAKAIGQFLSLNQAMQSSKVRCIGWSNDPTTEKTGKISPKKQEPKAKNTPTPKSEEVSTKAKKPAKDIYTRDALMAAFEQVSKSMGLAKENRTTLEKFLKQVIDKAVIGKVA